MVEKQKNCRDEAHPKKPPILELDTKIIRLKNFYLDGHVSLIGMESLKFAKIVTKNLNNFTQIYV